MEVLLLASDVYETILLSQALRQVGLDVSYAQGLEHAMRTWPDRPAEAILLALSAPSPLEQVRFVRSQVVLPMLMMIVDPTGKQALHVRLHDEGADLVVMRPYSTRFLTYKVQTLLSRVVNAPPPRLPAGVLL